MVIKLQTGDKLKRKNVILWGYLLTWFESSWPLKEESLQLNTNLL